MNKKTVLLLIILCGCFLTCNQGIKVEQPPVAESTPESQPDSTLQKLLERYDDLCKETEALMGKKFKQTVPIEPQELDDFMDYVQEQLDELYPEDLARKESMSLAKIGVLPDNYNLREALAELMKTQAGAYYEPEQKKIFILMSDLPAAMLEPILVHELTHALQDQYYDLGKLMSQAIDFPEDKSNALSFLVEGQATYTMVLYALKQHGMDPGTIDPKILKQVFWMQREMDRATMLAQNDMVKTAFGEDAKEIMEAMDSLKDVPNYLFRTLHDPYLKGAYTVFQIVSQDKNILDKLFKQELPDSTEQMLHPTQRLLEARDYPIGLELPPVADLLGATWQDCYTDVFGELGFSILFEDYLDDKSEIKAIITGWDGDQYLTCANRENQELILLWATTWDTAKDAQQFFKAYQNLLRKKYTKGDAIDKGDNIFVWKMSDGAIATCEIKDKDVVIVEAPEEIAAQLRERLFKTQKVLNVNEQEDSK